MIDTFAVVDIGGASRRCIKEVHQGGALRRCIHKVLKGSGDLVVTQ